MKKEWFLRLVLAGLVLLLAACPRPTPPPTPTPVPVLLAPKVELKRVEVAQFWPFFLDTKERRGSPLNLAFIFAIENPNEFNVMLDELKFTVAFEPGFEVNTIFIYEDMFIPPRTTNELRVVGSFDAFTTLLSLLVTGGFQLQELGKKAPEMVKFWWDNIGDFGYKIELRNGTASFKTPLGDSISAFSATFPR